MPLFLFQREVKCWFISNGVRRGPEDAWHMEITHIFGHECDLHCLLVSSLWCGNISISTSCLGFLVYSGEWETHRRSKSYLFSSSVPGNTDKIWFFNPECRSPPPDFYEFVGWACFWLHLYYLESNLSCCNKGTQHSLNKIEVYLSLSPVMVQRKVKSLWHLQCTWLSSR